MQTHPIGDFPDKSPTTCYEMPAIPLWEYNQQYMDIDEGVQQLNSMGKLGWELILVTSGGFNRQMYIFKRKLLTNILNG